MIQHIEIANFRGFSQPVQVRFRPITILIGKNSSGKSTLMKFLLMLRQTLENTEGDFFTSEGRHVELGALALQKNTNPAQKNQRLLASLSIRTPNGPSETMLDLLESIASQRAKQDGRKPFKVSFAPNGDKQNIETDYSIGVKMPYRRPDNGHHTVIGSQSGNQKFEFKAWSLKSVRFLQFPTITARPEGELEALIKNSVLQPVRQVLLESRHLLPVRKESQRTVTLANAPQDDVGHDGQFAVQQLHRILIKEDKNSAFLKNHIQSVANIDSLEFEELTGKLLSRFRARNLDTKAKCNLNDFGFGVGQCLPVLVQGCLLKKGQLLMVEQPEAQVHPTAQLELGSFFADLWQERGVPSLVETHSANIVLRLRQLISNQKLDPADVSIAYFESEKSPHVQVHNLDIYPDGRLEKGLPMEFFGADVLELTNFGIPE